MHVAQRLVVKLQHSAQDISTHTGIPNILSLTHGKLPLPLQAQASHASTKFEAVFLAFQKTPIGAGCVLESARGCIRPLQKQLWHRQQQRFQLSHANTGKTAGAYRGTSHMAPACLMLGMVQVTLGRTVKVTRAHPLALQDLPLNRYASPTTNQAQRAAFAVDDPLVCIWPGIGRWLELAKALARRNWRATTGVRSPTAAFTAA